MTLLESIVAFVVLALVGIACLDLSREAVQLQRTSAEWSDVVRVGDAAMAAAVAGDDRSATRTATVGASAADGGAGGAVPTVTRRRWRTGSDVDVIEVSVPMPGGGMYRLQRLAHRTAVRSRVAMSPFGTETLMRAPTPNAVAPGPEQRP